jgi:hypothetical protein
MFCGMKFGPKFGADLYMTITEFRGPENIPVNDMSQPTNPHVKFEF